MTTSIPDRFKELQCEYPNHSSLINFVRLMRETNTHNRAVVSRYFRLVSKEDYSRSDKQKLISWIVAI